MPMPRTLSMLCAAVLVFGSTAAGAADAVLIVTHQVRDFAAWKKVYDADKPNRDKHGVEERFLVRDAQNPNVITVVFEAPSTGNAQAFVSNPALKQAMEAAGVVGAPDIKIGTHAKGN